MAQKLFFMLSCIMLVLTGCSKKETVQHESPKFLEVVDSICEKNSADNDYNASAVIRGFHEYINYYGAAAPCFKDLPLTVTDTISSKTLDGSERYVTAFMNYNYEEPTDNGKLVYTITVQAETVLKADEPIPFKVGGVYNVSPKGNVLVDYDGLLDVVGKNEVVNGNGKIVDGRSFGTIKMKDVSFTEVK